MNKKVLLAAALTGLFVAGCSTGGGSSNSSVASGECHGINACKGKGECGGSGHACGGKNACKGQGWVKLSKADCEGKGGKFKTM